MSVKVMPLLDEDEMVLSLASHAACLRERLHFGNTREVIEEMVEEIRKRGRIGGEAPG